MDKEHTCCVTGHRDIPAGKVPFVEAELRKEILLAIEAGYTHFISGFASGTDLIFAEIVVDLKKIFAITLEAAIPYPGRMETPDKTFQNLIRYCDAVKIHASKYSKSCYMVRNRYMVDCSSRVIAVYDGRKSGGTAATIRYAHTKGCLVQNIGL